MSQRNATLGSGAERCDTGQIYLNRNKRQTPFAVFLKLYRGGASFRGFFDFFVIGVVVLLFVHPGLGDAIRQGTLSLVAGWLAENQLPAAVSVAATRSKSFPKAPVIGDVKINRKHFDESPPAIRAALVDAVAALKSRDPHLAIKSLGTSNEADRNVKMLRAYAMLAMRGVSNTRAGASLMNEAADAGQPQALVYAAIIALFAPIGVEADPTRGVTMLRRAIELGEADAALILARAYETGWAGTADIAKAVDAYRQGAELGHTGAMVNYAAALIAGTGVAKDAARGSQWLERAAQAGNTQAQVLLGDLAMLKYGMGTTSSLIALKWYRAAATLGNTYAMYQLGRFFTEYGSRTGELDVARGVKWTKDCVALGGPDCVFLLADFNQTGTGVPVDNQKAYVLFGIAAEAYRIRSMTKAHAAAIKKMAELEKSFDQATLSRMRRKVVRTIQRLQQSRQNKPPGSLGSRRVESRFRRLDRQ